MDIEILVASIALIISLISAIWSVWYNVSSNKSSRVNKTTELSVLFNASDFHNSRGIGWALLETINKSETPITFKMLWEDIYNENEVIKFGHLYRVLSFWQMLFVLGEQNEIDKKLTNRLFKYEFIWWNKQVTKLIKNTYDAKEEKPNFFEVFIKNPKWLIV